MISSSGPDVVTKEEVEREGRRGDLPVAVVETV
jgi:hypothetical protein